MRILNYICQSIFYKMKDRLYQILTKKKLTPAKFASRIGVSASAISHILSGRNKPGADFLANVADEFPDINLNWLLTGQGPWSNNPEEALEPIDAPGEATLFDGQLADVPPSAQPDATEEVSPEVKKRTQPDTPLMAFSQTPVPPGKGRKVKRIILFFDDCSFECYGE